MLSESLTYLILISRVGDYIVLLVLERRRDGARLRAPTGSGPPVGVRPPASGSPPLGKPLPDLDDRLDHRVDGGWTSEVSDQRTEVSQPLIHD